MKMTGSKILLECLKKEKVDILFGYPGGSVIPIFDALYDDKELQLILPRHEQAAVHAADGYARATGKVGVCLATSGPGATNLITGIATAYLDSVPLVAITGQVKTHLIGNDAFQEADVTGITRPVTKHNFLVKDVKDLAKTVKEAFHIARTGRPGPVVIDLPSDVQNALTDFKYPKEVHMRSYNPKYKGHKGQIEKLAKAIANSKKPVIYAGGGITLSNASKELTAFVKKTQIPVTTTLMALGTFPEDDRLSLGMPGMHGTAYANHAIQESDLLISLASRFDDRVTGKIELFAPNATIVHVDIDPASISKNVEVDIPIVGCVRNVLTELNKIVKKADTKEWLNTIDRWKKTNPLTYSKDKKLRPQYVIEQIDEITKGDTLVVTEVGQHQMWAAQFFTYTKPRTFISSGGLGTMGFGFPASLGVQLGCPDRTVFVIAGDGSIQMNTQELATAVVEKIPVKIAILNNGYLGMVRQWQELFYDKRYAHTCLNDPACRRKGQKNCSECKTAVGNYCPDFVKLAESYGAKGIRIKRKEDVSKAIKESLKYDGPVVMEFVVEPEENVYPMVPAGEAIDNMLHWDEPNCA